MLKAQSKGLKACNFLFKHPSVTFGDRSPLQGSISSKRIYSALTLATLVLCGKKYKFPCATSRLRVFAVKLFEQ